MGQVWVKICGFTRVQDAIDAAELGCDALGLNFAQKSPRCLNVDAAASLTREVREKGVVPEIVGVFVDASRGQIERIARHVGLDAIQLHGHESPEFLQELLDAGMNAFRAARIASAKDAEAAESYPGRRILVDAKVAGAMGGTGETFDWALVAELNRKRQMILAGGLRPENVGDAVSSVRPYGVDTASGVENAPGIKDKALMAAFIEAARKA